MRAKNKKLQVLYALEVSMQAKGWPLRRVAKLPPCYAHHGTVTPYFYCWGLAGRSFGSYLIEGNIGIVHEGFEALWAARFPGHPSERAFGVSCYIANFLELNKNCYVPYEGEVDGAVDEFCAAVVRILSQLPSNEDAVFDAFEEGNLYGRPIDYYRALPYVGKFDAFKEYVRGRFQ